MEIRCKLLYQIYLHHVKEVAKMGWHQIAFSVQATGKVKDRRKINICGLVDKKCQITFSNTSTHENEDIYDCIDMIQLPNAL
jgi:hypothetical protein